MKKCRDRLTLGRKNRDKFAPPPQAAPFLIGQPTQSNQLNPRCLPKKTTRQRVAKLVNKNRNKDTKMTNIQTRVSKKGLPERMLLSQPMSPAVTQKKGEMLMGIFPGILSILILSSLLPSFLRFQPESMQPKLLLGLEHPSYFAPSLFHQKQWLPHDPCACLVALSPQQ